MPVYEKVQDIERTVDMVQVFRGCEALLGVAHDAIDIGAKVLWGQIGARNDDAARPAQAAGVKVVMNRCPKIEVCRPFWKPRLNDRISAHNRVSVALRRTWSVQSSHTRPEPHRHED